MEVNHRSQLDGGQPRLQREGGAGLQAGRRQLPAGLGHRRRLLQPEVLRVQAVGSGWDCSRTPADYYLPDSLQVILGVVLSNGIRPSDHVTIFLEYL